ncbi:MAG TPA: enoyl-CoA hydratase/isomerase family protein [Jatrophihabitans sp.]|nr:enoyl-CoA hydratase/isomerase family protein [Jatrophihabitans sp.]
MRIETFSFLVDPEAGFRVDVHDQAATCVSVVLDRPDKLNCQSPAMWLELIRLQRSLPGTTRVMLLRAEGRAFSAGLDRALFTNDDPDGMRALPRLPQEEATARIGLWQQAFDWSSRPALVSIAAVQGHAVGAGFQLALGADIRIAADDVQFCMAEPTLGIVPDLGGTKRLVELTGCSRATEICLTGRRVGAEEALRIGLVSHVVPRAELDAAAQRTADAVLAVDQDAAAETKALLAAASTRSQHEQEQAEREAQYRRLRAMAGLDD